MAFIFIDIAQSLSVKMMGFFITQGSYWLIRILNYSVVLILHYQQYTGIVKSSDLQYV